MRILKNFKKQPPEADDAVDVRARGGDGARACVDVNASVDATRVRSCRGVGGGGGGE